MDLLVICVLCVCGFVSQRLYYRDRRRIYRAYLTGFAIYDRKPNLDQLDRARQEHDRAMAKAANPWLIKLIDRNQKELRVKTFQLLQDNIDSSTGEVRPL